VGGFAAYACRGEPGGYAADAACEDTPRLPTRNRTRR